MDVPQEFKDIQDNIEDCKMRVETATSRLEYFRATNSRFDMFAGDFASIGWKLREIIASLYECIAGLRDLENKIATEPTEEQLAKPPKETLNPGVYESDHGNAISWDGQVAYDLDMGEEVPFSAIIQTRFIRPLD